MHLMLLVEMSNGYTSSDDVWKRAARIYVVLSDIPHLFKDSVIYGRKTLFSASYFRQIWKRIWVKSEIVCTCLDPE